METFFNVGDKIARNHSHKWRRNLSYAARITSPDFRRTTVTSCNNGDSAQIQALLINPVGGVPAGFTRSFAGSFGATATFDPAVSEKSFLSNQLILTKSVGTAGNLDAS